MTWQMSRKSQDLEDVNKGEVLQSEMEDIIGENPDLDMDDAETSFAFGYQPTPKEEMHEKARMPSCSDRTEYCQWY